MEAAMGKFVFLVLSLAVVILLNAPALAGVASTGDVLAACGRTKGCWTEFVGGGDVVGCTPNVCFYCDTQVCASLRHAPGGTSSDRVKLLLSGSRAR